MNNQQQIIDIVVKELCNDFPDVELIVTLRKPLSQVKKTRSTGWFEIDRRFNDEGKEKGLRCQIHVHEIDTFNCLKQDKLDRSIANHREFLENIGAGLNFDSLFLYILLHEVGHVSTIVDMKRRNIQREYDEIYNINISSVKLAFSINRINDISKGPNIYSLLFIGEQLADKYAMTKFLPIWKKVNGNA
jgi:hypothetical protein